VKHEHTPPPDTEELATLREHCARQSNKIANLYGKLEILQEEVRYHRARAAKWEEIARECTHLVGQAKGLLETANDRLEFGP
jgi:hypothetical protein